MSRGSQDHAQLQSYSQWVYVSVYNLAIGFFTSKTCVLQLPYHVELAEHSSAMFRGRGQKISLEWVNFAHSFCNMLLSSLLLALSVQLALMKNLHSYGLSQNDDISEHVTVIRSEGQQWNLNSWLISFFRMSNTQFCSNVGIVCLHGPRIIYRYQHIVGGSIFQWTILQSFSLAPRQVQLFYLIKQSQQNIPLLLSILMTLLKTLHSNG